MPGYWRDKIGKDKIKKKLTADGPANILAVQIFPKSHETCLRQYPELGSEFSFIFKHFEDSIISVMYAIEIVAVVTKLIGER